MFLIFVETKQRSAIYQTRLLKTGKGFVLATGGIAKGKTTMINTLFKFIGYNDHKIHIVNPRINFNDILSYLSYKTSITTGNRIP